MYLTAALLAAALAAPASAGVSAPAVVEAAVSSGAAAGPTLDYGERRASRARAPVPPALRRLLRKRDLIAPELPVGHHATRDRSIALLAADLDRSAAARLQQARARPERGRVPLRLVLAGLLTQALHRPPPTLPG